MTRTTNLNVGRREVAKILGSSTAFIVVIVVLVVTIIVSCSAIIYLLTRDGRIRDQDTRRRRRYNAQPLVDSDSPHSRKWYSYLYLWGSRDRHNHTQVDKSATMMGGSEEANGREWDVNDFSEDPALRFTEGVQSGLLGMSEHESSATSFVGPRAYTQRMNSDASDGASSIQHYDPHAVRGLPYPDQFPISRVSIPSIQSQLYSPTLSSSPSSPVPRQMIKSPEPIAKSLSQDSSNDSVRDPQPEFALPVVHTARSGTKFFESL